MERRALKNLTDAKTALDFDDVAKYTAELRIIGIDQLYVAHFPNHLKYMALFGKDGVRIVDEDEKVKRRREMVRVGVWEKAQSGDTGGSSGGEGSGKGWVNMDFLDLGKKWSVISDTDGGGGVIMNTKNEQENEVVSSNVKEIDNSDGNIDKQQLDNDTNKRKNQKQMDDKEDGSGTSSSTSSDSSSDEDECDIMTMKKQRDAVAATRKTKDDIKDKRFSNENVGNASKSIPNSTSGSSDSSSCASSDSESENEEKAGPKKATTGKLPSSTKKAAVTGATSKSASDSDSSDSDSSDSDSDSSDSDSSDSDSSDSSSDSDGDKRTNLATTTTADKSLPKSDVTNKDDDEVESEVDDFLVNDDGDDDVMNTFAKATTNTSRDMSYAGKRGGDKSKGWQTQRQKPGEWKKPRRRV